MNERRVTFNGNADFIDNMKVMYNRLASSLCLCVNMGYDHEWV